MKPIILVYPHDRIFAAVKQESSLLAERKTDSKGNTLFEALVFDEEYLVKFRELFFDAQAEILKSVSAYLADSSSAYQDLSDFWENRDFFLALNLCDGFKLSRTVDFSINQFLIAYIMYRWLETKLPDEASVYLERSSGKKKDIKNMLDGADSQKARIVLRLF